MCKRNSVALFSAEEIETAGTWKRGRSTGPDKVPYETMKGIILDGEHWKHRLAAMYSDAMYKGCLPNVSNSVTTLLAKKPMPQSWGDTRPITLSCTALKVLAQLLLLRARADLVDPTGMQWSEKGKQTGEVIFALRRISRMALDWGKPIYVLKLDIRKACDSVVQARLGDLLFERLAVKGGKPWEARLWLQLVQCETLLVQTDGGNINIQQTNGVRQGSPDSPVLFAALMGVHRGHSCMQRRRGKLTSLQRRNVYGRHLPLG